MVFEPGKTVRTHIAFFLHLNILQLETNSLTICFFPAEENILNDEYKCVDKMLTKAGF